MDTEKLLYRDILGPFLVDRQDQVKSSTYSAYYVGCHTRLDPKFGDYRVIDITFDVVQDAVNDWAQPGSNHNTGEKLSRTSIRWLVGLLGQSLRFCERQYHIRAINLSDIRYEKVKTPEIEVFSTKDAEKLLIYIFKNMKPRYVGIAMGLLCGLRIGEVGSLKWSDVDLDKGVMYIHSTTNQIYVPEDPTEEDITKMVFKNVINEDTAKTVNSVRAVPLEASMRMLLKSIKDDNAAGDVYVISKKDKPVLPGSLRKTYYSLLKKLGLEKRKFHVLRHTFATTALRCGMRLAVLSKILGHSNPAITEALYDHPTLEDKAFEMGKIKYGNCEYEEIIKALTAKQNEDITADEPENND